VNLGEYAVRAGLYAVVDSVEYQASFSRGSDGVGLVVPGDQPCPPGFEHDERFGWWRKVPWSQVERIIEVATWARDADGYVLRLWMPPEGDMAWVAHTNDVGPFSDVPPGHPAHLRYDKNDNEWVGLMNVADLHEVTEIVRELPLAQYAAPRRATR